MSSKHEEANRSDGDLAPYPQANAPPAYSGPEDKTRPGVMVMQPQMYVQPEQPLVGIAPADQYFGGLHEYFSNASHFTIKQQVELGELILGFECQNQYSLRDQTGAKVMYAKENSNCWTRQCCGNMRNFEMTIQDFKNNDVVSFTRPLSCSWFCGKFCKDRMLVLGKDGRLLGSIEQKFSIFSPNLLLKDASGRTVFQLKGPCWPCCTVSWVCACNDVEFKLIAADGTEVGQIAKKWSGILKEAFTDADHFTITFPRDLSIEMKAVCMGALFLVDFEYFETPNWWASWGFPCMSICIPAPTPRRL